MLKKTKLLLSGLGVASVASGTMIGLYVHEIDHRQDRIVNKYLDIINDNINKIPGLSNVLSYDEFHDEITKRLDNHGESLTSIIGDILEDKIQESHDKAIAEISNSASSIHDRHDLFENELDRFTTEINDEIDNIKDGYVGDHDINYYKTLLENTVSKDQFSRLTSDVDSMDSQLQTLRDDILKNKNDIHDINIALSDSDNNGEIDIITDISNINTKLTSMSSKLDSLTANDATLNTEVHNIKEIISEIQTISSNNIQQIQGNTQQIEGLSYSIDNLKNKLDSQYYTVDEINTLNNDINSKVNNFEDKMSILNNKMEELKLISTNQQNKVDEITNEFKNEILVINKKITDFSTLVENHISNLYSRVSKNETEISSLKAILKNTSSDVNAKIDKLNKLLIDNVASMQGEIDANKGLINLNATKLNSLTNSLSSFSSDITSLQNLANDNSSKITELEHILSQRINDIRDIVANSFEKVDELSLLVNDNNAKILHLDERIRALEERIEGNKSFIVLFTTDNNSNLDGSLKLGITPFVLPHSINRYRALEIILWDNLTKNYFTYSINLDVTSKINKLVGGIKTQHDDNWILWKFDWKLNKISIAGVDGGRKGDYIKRNTYILQIVGVK